MFEQEGAALLGVTGVAGLVHRVLLDKLRAGRTMRIVAVRTYDLADVDRVGRKLVGFGALLLVASEANLGLRLLGQQCVRRRVHLVAVIAGDLFVLVLAAVPVGARLTLVTGETRVASRFRRRWGLWPGFRLQRPGLDGPKIDVHLIYRTLKVGIALPMAVLTTRRSRIAFHAHLGLIDREHRCWPGFVVADGARGISLQRRFRHSGGYGSQSGCSCATTEYERTQSHQLMQALHLFLHGLRQD